MLALHAQQHDIAVRMVDRRSALGRGKSILHGSFERGVAWIMVVIDLPNKDTTFMLLYVLVAATYM